MLAAAIAAKVEVIVTLNVRHPAEVLAPLGVEAATPDQFLCNLRISPPARTAQVLLQILSRQAPTFASRCMEFQIDTD